MPKFPPPPRSAQNRSGLSFSLAPACLASAVTTLAEMRLSMVKPNLRLIQPNPPPSVRPEIPVVELIPVGVTSPKACVSRSSSPRVTPGSTRAVRAMASTLTDFIRLKSIMTPPSHTALPAMLWPPPRTASSAFVSRAKSTATCTSLASAHRTITLGLRSIIAFHT